MRAGRRARRAGGTLWVSLVERTGGLVFQKEGDPPQLILGWLSGELLAEDWELEVSAEAPLQAPSVERSLTLYNGAKGEVFRVSEQGEIYVRGELVENNREVARKLLEVVFHIQGVVQDPSGPYRSRLERILDDD